MFDAVRHLQQTGRQVELFCAGKGDLQEIGGWIKKAGVDGLVTVLGLIEHDEVLRRMNHADLTVVPSRHEYPEGLPMTIMESLMVHTPVVASDHPMFVGRVGALGAVTFFQQMNGADMARAIIDVTVDKSEYMKRVKCASVEWYNLRLDLKWADLIDLWIDSPDEVNFSEHSLQCIT